MKKEFKHLCLVFESQTKAQEILFLLNGVKGVVRQGFYDSELVLVKKYCKEMGLFLVRSKFKVLLDDDNVYTNKGIRISEADERRGMYFIYISRSEEKALMASYYELVGDDFNLGLVLGYPKCCVEFFYKNFSLGKTDLELEATNEWTNLSKRGEDCVLLSHFPCSSDCNLSVSLGKKYFEVLENYDGERAKEVLGKLKVY